MSVKEAETNPIQMSFPFEREVLKQVPHQRGLPTPYRFFIFHRLNPFVYQFLVRDVAKLYKMGLEHIPMQYFFVNFRIWGGQTKYGQYRLSNTLSPYFSRAILLQNPYLEHVLIHHTLKSKNEAAWNRVVPYLEQRVSLEQFLRDKGIEMPHV